MAEYTMEIEENLGGRITNTNTTEDFRYVITPSGLNVNKIIGGRFVINLIAGAYDEVSQGYLQINSIVLKEGYNDTTYAVYNTPIRITPSDGTNTRRSIEFVITDLPTLIGGMGTSRGSAVFEVNVTKYNTVGPGWAYLGIPAQEIVFNTLNITAKTPIRVYGEHTPTFKLSATSDAPSGDVQYRWLYSEQGLNEWTPINAASTSLDYTWVLDDAPISGGKSYDVVLECTTYNIRSNIVRATIYTAPSASGASVSPTIGAATTQIELQCSSIQDPSNGVCPLQYQWQYNTGATDEWIALGGATSQTYTGQFTATTREPRFRLQVKNVDGIGYSNEVTYTAYVPTFPLNVEIGSPQYTTVSQINYSAGTSSSVQVTPASPDTTPVSNSYYTFQSQDGQYWITGYVGNWTNNDGAWTADIIWSSSNTDSLPAQSICWCVWTKEYYDSLIAQIGSGDGGGAVIKSIEYDLPSTTFTITDTNDQVTEINTSPSVAGADHPPYNLSDILYVDGAPLIRFGYSTGSSVSNISDMVIVTPVLSQTHEIYFDVSGTDLYVRRESPAGMYEPEITFNPIAEGNGSIVIHWRQNDVIRFHIPEDNFGFNYSVNISCDHLDTGWTCMYINTDTHAQGESHLAKSDDLPSNHLNSASNIVWVFANGRDGSISSSAYSVLDVTISIYRRTGTAEKD